MICPACKKETPDNSVFCIACGTQKSTQDVTQPGVIGTATQSRAQEWLALAEFQLSERVEGRVWESLKRYSRVAVVGLSITGTVVAFFGGSVLLDYVTSKVKDGLQRDARALQDRISEQVADMSLRAGELKTQADAAAAELGRLKQTAQESDKLSIQFSVLKQTGEEDSKKVDALEKEVTARIAQSRKDSENLNALAAKIETIRTQTGGLEENVTRIRALATSTDLSTKSLGGALLRSDLVGPAIVQGPSFFGDSGTLTGKNFGNGKGHVYLRIADAAYLSIPWAVDPELTGGLELTRGPKPIELKPESIKQWEEGAIEYTLSSADLEAVQQAKRAQKLTRFGLTRIEFQVETDSGKTSNWYGLLDSGFISNDSVPTPN